MGGAESKDDAGEERDPKEIAVSEPLSVSTLLRQAGKTLLALLLSSVYASLVLSFIVWAATFVYGSFYFIYAPKRDSHRFPLNFGEQG